MKNKENTNKEENKVNDKDKAEFEEFLKQKKSKEAEKAKETPETKMTRDQDSSEYLVYMHDTFGSSVRDIDPFKVNRAIQGGNIWLINEKLGFKEPMPENNKEYKNYKIAELTTEISKLEKQRTDMLKKKMADTKSSLKDLEQDLITYKGLLRSLNQQEEGSYLNISNLRDGRLPYFRFLRRGNLKMPMYTGIETGLIRVPNEFNIREAGDLLKENQEKNDPEKFLVIARWIILFLLIAAFIFMIWVIYKSNASVATCSQAFVNISDAFKVVSDGGSLNTDLLGQLVNNTVIPDSQVNVVPTVVNR